MLTSLFALSTSMLTPYNYSTDTIVNCTIAFLMSGIIGSIIIPKLAKKFQLVKLYRLTCILTLVFSISFVVVLPSENNLLLLANYAILGLVLIPVQPLGLMLVNSMC